MPTAAILSPKQTSISIPTEKSPSFGNFPHTGGCAAPFPPSPRRSMRGRALFTVTMRSSVCWAYTVQQGVEPRPAGAPARVHMFDLFQNRARLRARPGEPAFAPPRLPSHYYSSVVQLAFWMALSVSRSSRARESAFFRYSGTETALQILISDRVARRVRLLAAVRKFR